MDRMRIVSQFCIGVFLVLFVYSLWIGDKYGILIELMGIYFVILFYESHVIREETAALRTLLSKVDLIIDQPQPDKTRRNG